MKTRLVKGHKEFGFKIHEVIKDTGSYRTSTYVVEYSCGHIHRAKGSTISRRCAQLRRGRSTDLCTDCASNQKILDEWRQTQNRPPRKTPTDNQISTAAQTATLQMFNPGKRGNHVRNS